MGQTIPLHPNNTDTAQVTVADGTVTITGLEESDPELVALVEDAADAAGAVRQCLRLGARAANAVRVSVDTDLVERRFDDMATRFDQQVAEAVASIGSITEDLLGEEDGALAGALAGHTEAFASLLGDTFDPDSKRSVIALFEDAMRQAFEAHQTAVRRLVSLDGDDSPLGRLKRELAHEVKEQLGEVKGDLREISEKLAVDSAVAPVLEITTAKGFTFEDIVHARLCEIASHYDDSPEPTGHHLGSSASKKGDEVVTLSSQDVASGEGRIVFEMKNRSLGSRETHKELDAAMENRDAAAGVIVFSRQEYAPTPVPFHHMDDKAIVVLDVDDPDPGALRLAYMWARWVVRRKASAVTQADGLDVERVQRLVEDAARALDKSTAIRSAHTKARKSIEQAGSHLDELSDEVGKALDALTAEVDSACRPAA